MDPISVTSAPAVVFVPFLNVGLALLLILMLACLGVLVYLTMLSRGWTLPGQDAKLDMLTRHATESRRQAEAAVSSARIAHDHIDTLTRGLGTQLSTMQRTLDDVLLVREQTRHLENRMDAAEQDVEIIKAQLDSFAKGTT